MNRPLLTACILLAGSLVAATASADKEDDATRAAMVHKLLDTKTGDAGQTWSAFYEICGEECEYVAYGGCKRNNGAVDCEVRVYDVTTKKTQVIAAKDAERKPAALAKAKTQLTTAFENLGYAPMWLKETRFETPPQKVGTGSLRFQWDWKKLALTVLGDGKAAKKVKAGKLGKGLGVTSAAVWSFVSKDGSAGSALLRIHGEGEDGASGVAVTVFELPAFSVN